MKTYTITVNGTAYDVTVEETAGGAAPCTSSKSSPAAPAPQHLLRQHRQKQQAAQQDLWRSMHRCPVRSWM